MIALTIPKCSTFYKEHVHVAFTYVVIETSNKQSYVTKYLISRF